MELTKCNTVQDGWTEGGNPQQEQIRQALEKLTEHCWGGDQDVPADPPRGLMTSQKKVLQPSSPPSVCGKGPLQKLESPVSEMMPRKLVGGLDQCPATKELDGAFRICLYNGGPVAVSRLRKLLNDIDGRPGKPSFLAMYRNFCGIARKADPETRERMKDAVSAAWLSSDEDDMASEVCVHEIAHVAIPIYYKSAVHSYPVSYDQNGSGYFSITDPDWNHHALLAVFHATDPENRSLMVMVWEKLLLCLLAGEIAMTVLSAGEPPVWVLPDDSDPCSDMFKLKVWVKALRGFDDEEYQRTLQARCAEILMHPRTWEAIIVAASFLYERKEMDGAEVERIFETLSAPQFEF